MSGSIKIITGPMYASKTTTFVGDIERHRIAKRRCVIIKYVKDTRYDRNGEGVQDPAIISHFGTVYDKCTVIITEKLEDVDGDISIKRYDVIGISEGHFYLDLVAYANKWADMGKHVIVDGLNGDFAQQPFKPMSDLIPYADSIVHKTAVCMRCFDRDAGFTHRTTGDTDQYKVGGVGMYIALCRQCKSRINLLGDTVKRGSESAYVSGSTEHTEFESVMGSSRAKYTHNGC
jgi:thymidine kinase